jgi:hypothetical protein
MSETEIKYIPVDTSEKGSDSLVLKELRKEKIVPVIPPDPEDEIIDSTQIEDQFGNEDKLEARKVSAPRIPTAPRAFREPSTHASRTADKY